MGQWYVPSLKVRKDHSGKPCPGCSLILHWIDMVAYAMPQGTVYLHDACAEVILTRVAEDVIHNVESAGNDD